MWRTSGLSRPMQPRRARWPRLFLVGCLLVALPALASPPEAAEDAECRSAFARFSASPLVQWASQAAGLMAGSVNDLIQLTCLKCAAVIPPALGPWLPLANEIAHVAKTATGQDWIYSGMTKQLADSVALGSILGHSLTATVAGGPITGGITLAANLGLTYWFPNKYLYAIMHGAPELLPKGVPFLRSAAGSRLGRGVIGVSVIVVIEQILHKAESLAEKAPHLLQGGGERPGPAGRPAEATFEPMSEEAMRKAIAAYLLEAKLREVGGEAFGTDQMRLYAFGGTREGGLFSAEGASVPEKITLSPAHKRGLRELTAEQLQAATQNLLRPAEAAEVRFRLEALLR